MTPCFAEGLGYLYKQLLLSARGFYTCNEDYQMFVKISKFQ